MIAWGIEDNTHIWWWEVFPGVYHSLELPSGLIGTSNIDLSPDSRFLATCTDAGLTIVPLDSSQPTEYARCRAPGIVVVSADSRTVFIASATLIDAIDVESGQVFFSFRGHSINLAGLAATEGRQFLVSGSEIAQGGFELFLWRIDPRAMIRNWIVPENWEHVGSVDITIDGNLIVANLSNRLRAFRISDGQQVKIFDFGSDGVAFSPGDQFIVLGNSVWQVSNWNQLKIFEHFTAVVNGIAFMPNGKSWLSISQDGMVRLWGIP
jgi:WD40 repeat protein